MSEKIVVGVAGAGAMGSGIAHVAAGAGHKVVLFDTNAQAVQKAKIAIESDLKKLVSKNKISENEANARFSAITFSQSLSDFKNCMLVIEAIIENLDIKKNLFAEIENVVSADCILATNTSSLAVVAVASSCKKRDRFVGIHFFNPATIMPLVEIIPAFTSENSAVELARSIIDSWGKVTVLAKDTPGFIVNRIARPYYGEALRIYEEGKADFSTIDYAMKQLGGFKMGPFELMDFIGNDINYKVTETVWEQFFYDPRYRPSITQKRLFEAELFGRKSGRGYYNYSENAKAIDPVTDTEICKNIFERILAMLINEAADAVYFGVASINDIELAMTKGVNYPKGLLKWADEFGIQKVVEILEVLHEDYYDDRYRPSLLLKKMAMDKKKFF